MKVVLTVLENRISPVADSARQLLVVDVENRTIQNRHTECFKIESVFYRARRLSDLEVEIFICGAISDFFASLLEGYGIRLIPFICGEAEEVLYAYLEDSLPCPRFMITGELSPYRVSAYRAISGWAGGEAWPAEGLPVNPGPDLYPEKRDRASKKASGRNEEAN